MRQQLLLWLYAWAVWVGFNALVLVLYPTVIAPLFNKFEPLADGDLARASVRCSPAPASRAAASS